MSRERPAIPRLFGQVSWLELINRREIWLPFKQMIYTDKFCIAIVIGVIIFSASKLPSAVRVPDNKFDLPFFSKNMPAY